MMCDYGLTRFVNLIEERKLGVYGVLVHQHGRNVLASDAPEDPGERMRRLTLHDVLAMASGHLSGAPHGI